MINKVINKKVPTAQVLPGCSSADNKQHTNCHVCAPGQTEVRIDIVVLFSVAKKICCRDQNLLTKEKTNRSLKLCSSGNSMMYFQGRWNHRGCFHTSF